MTSNVPVSRVSRAQRVVEARVGQHDADVGERRLGEHAGDVARRPARRSSAATSLNCTTVGGQRRVDLRADAARPGDDRAPSASSDHERLVDGAVVAPVEHEHLRPARDLAGEAQDEAVGVGGGQRDLPQRQPEPAGQLGADPRRVVARAASS